MSKKPARLEVTCPCCQATMLVEATTGLVLKSQDKKPDYSLEEAVELEKERKSKADEVFAQAFVDEKKRHESLEEKFKKALDAKDELEDPTRPWDFD
jgi:hypothetical protein